VLSPFRVFVIVFKFLPKNYEDVYDLSQRKGKEFKMPIHSTEHFSGRVYKPRNPKASCYYQCVAAHFETFEMVWGERYERQYGF
jgi:hypothetical protein